MNTIKNLINKNPWYSWLIFWIIVLVLLWIREPISFIIFSLTIIVYQLDLIINKQTVTLKANNSKINIK